MSKKGLVDFIWVQCWIRKTWLFMPLHFHNFFLLTFKHWKIRNSWCHTRKPYAITTVKQMILTSISIVSARVGREFQNSRVTITTGERTEFGNLNVHLYRQSYISQVDTQRNLAILKHPSLPDLIWKGALGSEQNLDILVVLYFTGYITMNEG